MYGPSARLISKLAAGSVKKTRKAVIVHEAPVFGGAGAEIAAALHKEVFDYLDAPIERVGALETPVPYSSVLEQAYLPDEGGSSMPSRKCSTGSRICRDRRWK